MLNPIVFFENYHSLRCLSNHGHWRTRGINGGRVEPPAQRQSLLLENTQALVEAAGYSPSAFMPLLADLHDSILVMFRISVKMRHCRD